MPPIASRCLSCIRLPSTAVLPVLQSQMRVDKMSVRISFTLEVSEKFLFLYIIFSLDRAFVIVDLERISVWFIHLRY